MLCHLIIITFVCLGSCFLRGGRICVGFLLVLSNVCGLRGPQPVVLATCLGSIYDPSRLLLEIFCMTRFCYDVLET